MRHRLAPRGFRHLERPIDDTVFEFFVRDVNFRRADTPAYGNSGYVDGQRVS
jgi:hypothetical protein